MALVKWALFSSVELVETLESITTTSRKLSTTVVDNETDRQRFMSMSLRSDFTLSPVASGHWKVWIITSLDGTNYEDGTSSITPARPHDVIFDLRGATGQQVVNIFNVEIPPLKFKLLCINESGQTTTSTLANNEILVRRHTEEIL